MIFIGTHRNRIRKYVQHESCEFICELKHCQPVLQENVYTESYAPKTRPVSNESGQQGQFCEDNLTKLLEGPRGLIGEKSKYEKCRYGC